MKAAVLLSAAALALSAVPAEAQFGQPQKAPKTWASAWVGGLLSPGRVFDPASSSVWAFGSSFSGGLGLHRVYATVAVDNTASRRVLEANGFTLIGIERRSVLVRDGMHDGAAYELLAEDLTAR